MSTCQRSARGEIRWCQGYSEPGAGSDLASLQTRAEDDGDHYLVNGQKIWTSYANKADWFFCLVRTDSSAKKHEGIQFLLFDMRTPGVTTRPILLISGYSPFCETFFDNVRVPKKNVVGTVNKGWDVAKYVLQFERRFDQRHRRPRLKTLDERDRDLDGRRRQGRQAGRSPAARESRSSRSTKSPLRYAAERAADAGQGRPGPSGVLLGDEVLRLRAEQAPPRAVWTWAAPTHWAGRARLRATAARRTAGCAPRQLDRGRHLRGQLGIVAKRILNLPGT